MEEMDARIVALEAEMKRLEEDHKCIWRKFTKTMKKLESDLKRLMSLPSIRKELEELRYPDWLWIFW